MSLIEKGRSLRSPRAGGGVPPIAVSHLTKRFGSQLAVDDLSFTVGWGKVTGFLGPNGAGKTTTLRLLLGLATPGRWGRAVLAGGGGGLELVIWAAVGVLVALGPLRRGALRRSGVVDVAA